MADTGHSAMVLAAGRGERMRPLTDRTPKSLLEVGGQPLIEHHIDKLAAAGFARIVINHAYLGEQIVAAVGDGSRWGVTIRYSPEVDALETAGGIANALPLIDADAFAVVNSDVYSNYDYAGLKAATSRLTADTRWQAHLILVGNPAHNRAGDFALEGTRVAADGPVRLTFSGMGAYRSNLFSGIRAGEKQPLAPLLRDQARVGRVSGEQHLGQWTDVGTPQRLASLNKMLTQTKT
jgi:MurNAc alpha-1-phosphate uridylyltransferase